MSDTSIFLMPLHKAESISFSVLKGFNTIEFLNVCSEIEGFSNCWALQNPNFAFFGKLFKNGDISRLYKLNKYLTFNVKVCWLDKIWLDSFFTKKKGINEFAYFEARLGILFSEFFKAMAAIFTLRVLNKIIKK